MSSLERRGDRDTASDLGILRRVHRPLDKEMVATKQLVAAMPVDAHANAGRAHGPIERPRSHACKPIDSFVIEDDLFDIVERLIVVDFEVVRHHAGMVDDRFRIFAFIIGSASKARHEGALPVLRSALDRAAAAEFRQGAGDRARVEATA